MKPSNIFGLTIFSAGALVLVGFGLYKLFGAILKDNDIPIVVKWGIVGLILGVVIILFSLIIERLKDKKKEKIKQ